MRALRFDRFGQPDVLRVAEVPDPVAGDGEAVVAVRAGSVNPSDLKNVAGAMEGTILPRVPGRDFAGVVVQGPADWIGAQVWGTGGDIGFTRDGSHAELLAVPAAALVRKPERLSFEEASAVGVNFVVGWLGAVETACLDRGETIAVFGVSGGVGGAVAQIARVRGARVIGIDRVRPRRQRSRRVAHRGVHPVRRQPRRDRRPGQAAHQWQGRRRRVRRRGRCHHRGRPCLARAPRPARRDQRGRHPHRGDRPRGPVPQRDQAARCRQRQARRRPSGARLAPLTPYFESGQFAPLPIARRYGLDQGTQAYQAVADRVPGRVVICP
jgi:NADPH:quinone reductase